MKLKTPFFLSIALFISGISVTFAQKMPVHVFAGGGGRNISVNLPTVQHFDYGDAPEDNPQYPTLLSSDGARHHLNPSAGGFLLTLGTKVDTELDGQPSASASGDDAQGPFDDESGVAFVNSLQPGGMAEIEVWVSGDGHLDAWVDFNRNGSWLDPGEQIFQAMQVGPNLNILSFSVPALAVTGDTYARFRLSSNGMLAPTGSAPDGEVEDYLVTIGSSQNVATDWGDAGNGNTLQNGTASYPVAASDNGAYHLLTTDLRLGSAVDAEPDGQPSTSADGDDLSSVPDDEDGVIPTGAIETGQMATFNVVANEPGRIDAWVDFNQDGHWAHPGEQIFASQSVVSGVNVLTFAVPSGAETGGTYFRFRISSGGGLAPGGGSSDGEVEDYFFGIEPGPPPPPIDYDWGDAPNITTGLGGLGGGTFWNDYPTQASQSPQGAHHLIANGIHMGALVDSEPDGQPHVAALGDDNNGVDDEDGVFFSNTSPPWGLPLLEQGATEQMAVVASASGYINAFLDFNQDGDWTDPGEKIVMNGVAVAGTNVYSFSIPSSAKEGYTYLRVRINSTGGLGSTGGASDGEVEDYTVEIKAVQPPVLVDWGDAPKGYPTLESSVGASHEIDDLFLGDRVDSEPDGQPSPLALGDDLDGNDDDDGVQFLNPLVSGGFALIKVFPSMTGILDAWIDGNGDKDWDDSGEKIFDNVTVNPGQVLVFEVPKIKKPLRTFVRFRLSHGGSNYDGDQIGGEVEDYRVKIGKKWAWTLDPQLPDMLVLNWNAERGVDYVVQSSTTPQQWIRENLGEHEVSRIEKLFSTGLAWEEAPLESPMRDMDFYFEWGDEIICTSSARVPINPSKKMVLFRVIAMPE